MGGDGDAAHLGGHSDRDLEVDLCRDAHCTHGTRGIQDALGDRSAVVEYLSRLFVSPGTDGALEAHLTKRVRYRRWNDEKIHWVDSRAGGM